MTAVIVAIIATYLLVGVAFFVLGIILDPR